MDNMIAVCPTGHYNIHVLLNEFKVYMGKVPYSILRTFAFNERKYAELGFKRLTRGEM